MNTVMNKKVGELLKEARLMRGKNLDEISDVLKINKAYLKGLEDGNWDIFPAEVYIKGFLKNYAKYLGIDEDRALRTYRRERYVDEEVKVLDHGQKDVRDLNFRSFRLTKTSVTVFTALVSLVVIILFFTYQVFVVQQKPPLEITEPLSAQANSGEDIKYDTTDDKITIEGKIGVGDTLFLNGEQVFTLGLSQFQIADLKLESGENKLELESKNQFGISSQLRLVVIKSVPTQ